MNEYQIQLQRHGRLWAELTVSGSRLAEVHDELRNRFAADVGFNLRIQRRKEQRRIVECGPDGVRLLGIQYQYLECEDA